MKKQKYRRLGEDEPWEQGDVIHYTGSDFTVEVDLCLIGRCLAECHPREDYVCVERPLPAKQIAIELSPSQEAQMRTLLEQVVPGGAVVCQPRQYAGDESPLLYCKVISPKKAAKVAAVLCDSASPPEYTYILLPAKRPGLAKLVRRLHEGQCVVIYWDGTTRVDDVGGKSGTVATIDELKAYLLTLPEPPQKA
jgi:hypothetical protein